MPPSLRPSPLHFSARLFAPFIAWCWRQSGGAVMRVSGHCRYATAWQGQCGGRMAFSHQHAHASEALPSGETVHALLTHSDNDPRQLSVLGVTVAPLRALRPRYLCIEFYFTLGGGSNSYEK